MTSQFDNRAQIKFVLVELPLLAVKDGVHVRMRIWQRRTTHRRRTRKLSFLRSFGE